MRRIGRTIAIALVLAALCADRAVAAAPALRPEVGAAMSRLAARFSSGFTRKLPAVVAERQSFVGIPLNSASRFRVPSANHPIPQPTLSPFNFRLPPPTHA